jgi:hypothetical protein
VQASKRNTFVRSSIRSALLVLACAIVLVALVGCGGGSKQDADKVLDQTFSGNRNIKSAKLNVRVVVDANGISGLNGPLNLTLTGPFESQGQQLPKFDLDVKLAIGGRTFSAGAVSTGDKGFIKFQGSSYALPDSVFAGFKQGFERARAQRTGGSRNTSLASLGIDPRKWLKDPKSQGDEQVAGQSTTHVSSTIDVPKLLDDAGRVLAKAGQLGVAQSRQLPTSLTAQQKKAVANAIENPTFDVFSGKDDKILRKVTLAFDFKVPKNQQQRANGLKSGKLMFDVELAGVNQPQTVQAPATPKPFAELRTALSSLAGLLAPGGAGTGSGGSATTPSGGSNGSTGGSPQIQAYAQCVTAAGGDVAKTQACAKLLPSR